MKDGYFNQMLYDEVENAYQMLFYEFNELLDRVIEANDLNDLTYIKSYNYLPI